MGGTMFNEGSATYWNTGNTATCESAKGYIPETAWNESARERRQSWRGGGGASMYFPQPSWQTTAGVPNDGWRHVPDISFNASVYAVPYYVYCRLPGRPERRGVRRRHFRRHAHHGRSGGAAESVSGTRPVWVISIPASTACRRPLPARFTMSPPATISCACAYGSPGCSNGEEGYTAGGRVTIRPPGSGRWTWPSWFNNGAAPGGHRLAGGRLARSEPGLPGEFGELWNFNQWNFQLTLTEDAGFATTLTGFTVNGTDYSSQIAAIFGTAAIAARQSISGCIHAVFASVPANGDFRILGRGREWRGVVNHPHRSLPRSANATDGGSEPLRHVLRLQQQRVGQQVFAPGMIMSVYGTAFGTLAQAATTIPLPEYMAGFEAYVCPVSCRPPAPAIPPRCITSVPTR